MEFNLQVALESKLQLVPTRGARPDKLKLELQLTLKRGLHPSSCFTPGMSDDTQRLDRIESNLSHLEKQYEELNEVVVQQARIIARLQKEHAKVSTAVQTMEIDRISANNTKPPHYQ